MISKCESIQDYKKILEYVDDSFEVTPYLYLNLMKYGVGSQRISVYVDAEDTEILGVYLDYYGCLHFYSKNPNYSVETLHSVIELLNPHVIMLPGFFNKMCNLPLSGKYECMVMELLRLPSNILGKYSPNVSLAKRDELPELALSLLQDPAYSNIYTYDVLLAQLLSRFDENFGRMFVIYADGKIVATIGTNGEFANNAMSGSLWVHPNYRKNWFALELIVHLCSVLNSENKSCLSLVKEDNIASLRIQEKIGAVCIGKIIKYVRCDKT